MNREDYFDYLVLAGIVEFAGIDPETNQMLYNFTKDLEQIDPEMYKKVIGMIQEDIYVLWEKGFLDMDVTLVNPLVRLTNKALDPDIIKAELTKDEQLSLDTIKMYMAE